MSMTQMHWMKTAINSIYSSNVGTLVVKHTRICRRPLFLDQGRHHGSFFDIPVASSEVGSIEFTFLWEDGRWEGKNYRMTVQDLNKTGDKAP